MISRFISIVFVLVSFYVSPLYAIDTSARSALVVDHNTGTILLSKNADVPLPPASMSKLMTLNMVFEALDEGRLSLDDTFRVSPKAAQKGGSKMFVREGASIRVEDLIRGIIVQSGNDACIVLAEGLAGSEQAFAERMTQRAQDLGMTGSNFVNATGWPDPGQQMSATDLVFLARRIITKFPQYYSYFSEKSFTWEDITQDNRNPLLALDMGADGLKTGHTEEAGYGLVGSAIRDGRRIVFVIGGLDSAAARSTEAERLTSWAFREFAMKTLFESGKAIAKANVWLGSADKVEMQLANDVTLLLPLEKLQEISASYTFNNPIEAPIMAGQQIGELNIEIPDMDKISYPLVASTDIQAGGFLERLKAATDIILRRIRSATSGT